MCCSVCRERLAWLEQIHIGLGGQVSAFSVEAAPAQSATAGGISHSCESLASCGHSLSLQG